MQSCGNCHFGLVSGDPLVIICRRYPPYITEIEGTRVTSNNPLLSRKWWCGEWKKRVNGKVDTATVSAIREKERREL